MDSETPGLTPKIIWIADDRLSGENLSSLTRVLNYIKHRLPVAVVKASQFKEDALLFRLKTTPFDLVVAPLREYLRWERIDNLFGVNRNRGPIFMGYFCEPIENQVLEGQINTQRRILLDCLHLMPSEIFMIVESMLNERKRSGIQAFLQPQTKVYCENWYPEQALGIRLDNVLATTEISTSEWAKRSGTLRLLLSSFWGLIYEEGPGRTHEGQPKGQQGNSPIAYFQLAADEQCLAMRLIYQPGSHASPLDTLRLFTPDPQHPTRARQLMLHYSDFLRVHSITENGHIEILALLFPSAPIEKDTDHLHSVWIDPISENSVTERPYVGPNPLEPRLRALPTVSVAMPRLKALDTLSGLRTEKATSRILSEATHQIRDLKNKVKEQNEKLKELRSGGIGYTHTPPPPEPEDLLTAFQERYFDARYRIRQFELQIEKLEKEGGKPYDIEVLHLKMEALENRERAWIRKLMSTLEDYRNAMKTIKKKSD